MTEDEKKIAAAFRKCADVRLPDDFADRLIRRIREKKDEKNESKSIKTVFTRIALIAASLTLLLGFVPNVLEPRTDKDAALVAHYDEIRPVNHTLPQDSQLNALAFLGFFREVIRRRVKPLVERFRKREDESINAD